jgi:hypothetical protein
VSVLRGADEQEVAWELRGAWAARRRVVLRLDAERCVVVRLVGKVAYVDPTGAFVEFADEDGGPRWKVHCRDVLAVRSPHFTEPGPAEPEPADDPLGIIEGVLRERAVRS